MCAIETTLVDPEGIIRITVNPAFARLAGGNHRMSAGVRVFARVAIRRTVAAKSHSAFLAGSQMDPGCSDLDAFAALHALRMFYFRDRFEVSTV